jgi:hypothetical protein
VPAKNFAPPRAIGQVNQPNDVLQRTQAAPMLPQNIFQPLIQNGIPSVQSPNAVPGGSGVAGVNNYAMNPFDPKYTEPKYAGSEYFEPESRYVSNFRY